MSKRIFILLVLLMSLSLIGIIFVQAFFIKDSVENERNRFESNVISTLYEVSNKIDDKEYYAKFESFQKLINSETEVDSNAVSQLFIYQQNKNTKEALIYRSGVLEENYKLSQSLFDIGLDSIAIQRITGTSSLEVYKGKDLIDDTDLRENPIISLTESGRIKEAEANYFRKNFRAWAKTIPIHKRVSNEIISEMLTQKLKEDNIDLDFEYAIYSNGLATKVQSENFEYDKHSKFRVPIFYDDNGQTPYKLLVDFPNDHSFVLSSILGMILLSIVFTGIIIIAYASALYQLIKQRKISEIKTDFINNMTHEFKTPIATINLALDAIRNPTIINDKDKVKRYLSMIKEENKRMHAQVENVLRISKLEKNELNISKDRVRLHDLIETAIAHVELIVENRKGYIKTSLEANKSSILANETHFTNVIVNILDNAIKYSPNAPEIEVSTENVGTNILLKIKDHGSGMSKAAVKRAFEKFYREHTGNIHNVKGHGLGLAYVKRIVDDHQGYVSVESEKGKGSTFSLKLPLIS
ncbi:sensor histidine kinase KdpD [Seonamhaeicola sp. ML3]|uniref:sensor histidine kinase n=1 Tax=Seonamhaeicola sp. ML3 TaxID=2937786 RepID=UPI00200F7274|nr:HAMP domain-containing sensor histidine kinase [Seonamhaeicola sp. ML3]